MVRAAFATLLTLALLLPRPVHAAGPADFPMTSPPGRWFTETNGYPVPALLGYGVYDLPTVKFWSEFQRLGGVPVLGYPISEPFYLDGYVVQAFQKAILQWHAETGLVEFVNVYDRLHTLGRDGYLQTARQTPPPLDTGGDTGKSWPAVVAARQALLNGDSTLRAAYFADSDPLDHFGLPMTGPVDEGNAVVVRCQRAVLQRWKVAVPWAAAGQVTVANGGDIAKETGLVPLSEDSAFRPSFDFVDGGPIRKDAYTLALQTYDLGPGWVFPFYVPVTLPGEGSLPVPLPQPTGASQGWSMVTELTDPGTQDAIYLQVLAHGLVNRNTTHYSQPGQTKGALYVIEQVDTFQSPDGPQWNYARRVGRLAGANERNVPISTVGDESTAWTGPGWHLDGTQTSDYTVYVVAFRRANVTVVEEVTYVGDPSSVDFAVHLAQLTLARIQA